MALKYDMLEDSSLCALSNRAYSQAKIKISDTEVNKIVCNLFGYLQLFNSLTENSIMLWGRSINDIDVPNEFADFVWPSSVKFDPADPKAQELLIRTKPDPTWHDQFTLTDYIDTLSRWRRIFKKDLANDMTSLGSLKKAVSLNDVRDKVSPASISDDGVNGYARYIDQPFIPIPILLWVGDLWKKDVYFNSDYNSVIDEYIAIKRFE